MTYKFYQKQLKNMAATYCDKSCYKVVTSRALTEIKVYV